MSGQNCFIQQPHDNTTHGGLHGTYQNLTDKYHQKHSLSPVKKFVESCEICKVTQCSTQEPVGLLTLLTVPQGLWIEIAMHFLFLTQLVVDCTKLIPDIRFSETQKPHFVTFSKVPNIIARQSGYTYIIPYTGGINEAGVIVIFDKHIKPTIGRPFSIVSE